jgi:hypothetical protein
LLHTASEKREESKKDVKGVIGQETFLLAFQEPQRRIIHIVFQAKKP